MTLDAANSSEERLRRIEAVTDAALAELGLEELLAELLERTRDLLHADTATVLLVDPTATELVATAAAGLEEEVRQGARVPIGAGFAGRVAAERVPITLAHVDHTNVVNPILLAEHIESILGVPMISGGQVIGVLHVGTRTPRRFVDEDIELLRLVADRASLATQARLSRLDRDTTLALQRSLLPARLPAVNGLDVAARYVPGADVGVGGDWYDLFRLPSGHVGVVIGDVAGSGLRAAVVMGRIRSALRAYAMETTDPADVLTRLDRKIQLFEPTAMATAMYGVMDPTLTTLTLSTAGHPPPAVIRHSEAGDILTVQPDLPLGAYPEAPRRSMQTPLEPGDCLLLYTDGLIERRDEPIDAGFKRLRAALEYGTAESVCAKVMTALLAGTVATDDTAIIALRKTTTDRRSGSRLPKP